ncbi:MULTISPECIES: MFS transporter [Providencia]|uniref:MFS transporter n=1 Tax=Providencia TaxID=586 RepID=UPI00197E0E94|nr:MULTISPECIES: MFS transporter [Providencia]MBN4864964.1 MFS transporter [Providencia stuartii]MBN4874811.1 MFS transporter [Providencia stuartii]MBN4878976.1 MFS transporter [Providencia stuartii]MBN4884011.1 MFS transporter [Providencia stuartii]
MNSDKIFSKVAYSNLFAQMSEQIALAVTPLVAVLILNASASDTAWLQMLQTLPFLIVSPFIGIVADRHSARNLMICSEAIRIAVLGMIFALLFSKLLSFALLILFGFIGAVGTVIYSVATSAYIPAVIPKDHLINANRWIELARSLSYTAGPALGGVLVGYIGASSAYSFAIILSVIALILIFQLPKEHKKTLVSTSLLKQLKEGADYIFHNPYLKPILLTALFFNTAWFIIQGVFTAYAVTVLKLSAQQIGIAISVYGIGMIVGALGLRHLSLQFSYGTLVIFGPVCGLFGATTLLFTVWNSSFYLVCFAYFLFGAGPIIWTISTVSLRQSVTPNLLIGRVSALMLTTSFGARPLGSAIAAIIATLSGVEYCLWAAVFFFAIQLGIISQSPVRALKAMPAISS